MDSNKALELARLAYPNDENLRVAYMLGVDKGYEFCREDILKDAVESEAEELYNDGESQCTVGVGTYFKPGDKVYVIKAEEE